MASDQSFVDFLMDQLSAVPGIASRKMFGEYAVYVEGKVVALVCDNDLFVKPTDAGRQFIGQPDEAAPFPGAKPSFRITDSIDDRQWLEQLVMLTANALPAPKPKTKKKSVAKNP